MNLNDDNSQHYVVEVKARANKLMYSQCRNHNSWIELIHQLLRICQKPENLMNDGVIFEQNI
jgi:hypothetical protein